MGRSSHHPSTDALLLGRYLQTRSLGKQKSSCASVLCRNNAWFKKHSWYADELVELKRPVGPLLS
jgi:hypothetical protein